MGTAIGLDLRDEVEAGAIDRFFDYLRDVDDRFSTYKPDSEISRLARGDLEYGECSADVREALELCERARVTSHGYFDVRGHGRGGLDPSGLVKGWALEKGARLLDRAGARNYCVNGGGDVIARGEPEPGRPWRVGIRHPIEPGMLAGVLLVHDLAVATSGAYERGEHVIDPFTGRPPRGVLSMTVAGPDLTFADAYATAAFAMGLHGLAWLLEVPEHEGCAITFEGDGPPAMSWTPGFERLMAPAPQAGQMAAEDLEQEGA